MRKPPLGLPWLVWALGALFVIGALAALVTGGGRDYAGFREVYIARATYNDPFRERPPELTNEQIDSVVEAVCVDGEPNLDVADLLGRQLAGGIMGSSALGSALYAGVEKVGCP